MNSINIGGANKSSLRKTGDYIIKRSPPLAMKKMNGNEPSTIPTNGIKAGAELLSRDNIKMKLEFSKPPSRGSYKAQQSVGSIDTYSIMTNKYDNDIKPEVKQMEPQLPAQYLKKDYSTNDSVPKAKYDELREKYDQLLLKYDDAKKKLKEMDICYRSEVDKNKALIEENKVLKQKLKDAQKSKQSHHHRGFHHSHSHPQEETKNEMDENELLSLQLALKLQREEVIMDHLTQLVTMQMYQERQQHQPIDLNNPESINPDQMTYEQLLELEEKLGKVSKGLSKEDIKKIPKHTYFKLGKDEQCSICFCEYNTGEKLRKLNCSHQYHSKCIKQWLTNEKTCPICKAEVVVS